MKFLALQPFVPAGKEFELSKQFFVELGFKIRWESEGYAGLESGECRFILQHFDNREFAENFMLTVTIENSDIFYKEVIEKHLPEKFGIRINPPSIQSYGKEVNIIDIAGVCWHFVEG